MKKYDLIVIGSGSGGSIAAKYAARVGAKVLIIEKSPNKMGGECLHAGCVPSKALINVAKSSASSWPTVRKNIERSIDKITVDQDSPEVYKKLGIDVVFGTATLLKKRIVRVDTDLMQGRRIIIATGSSPMVPSISGLKKVGYETNESIFYMKKLPKQLAIIGGGPIAIEMACAFSKLGSKVSVMEHNPRILKQMDEEAATLVENFLKSQGVQVVTSASVVKITGNKRQKILEVRSGGDKIEIKADTILVATGRVPNNPIGLSDAGVKTSERGIPVDDKWRTSNKRIYAVGDVTTTIFKFTHVASMAGAQAALHAVLGAPVNANIDAQPYVFFTDPEVAQVGVTVAQLEKDGVDHRVYTIPYGDIDKAVTDNEDGFIKLITTPKGKILGGTVAGQSAGELIGYIANAVDKEQSVGSLVSLLQPYPTLSLGVKQLAIEANFDVIKRYSSLLSVIRKLRSLV